MKLSRKNLKERSMILGPDQTHPKWIYLFQQRRLVLQLNQESVKKVLGLKLINNLKQPVKVGTTELKETEKVVPSFILENEINKIKIPIPLIELMKIYPFRKFVLKALQPPSHVTF
jgi:hypothetical protein